MTEQKSGPELQCRTCNVKIFWNSDYPYRPFCSKRCQEIDFGGWANEEHSIAGKPVYGSINDENIDDENY